MTTLPDTQWLELELSYGWLRIFLNAPKSRNALSQALSDEGREGVASFFAKRKPSWATRTDN